MSALIKILMNEQRETKESDSVFGARIGMKRRTWQAIRVGRRRLTMRHLGLILQHYPQLTDEVIAYLKDMAQESDYGRV